MINSIPSSPINSPAPYLPTGRGSFGVEDKELQASTFKPTQQAESSARQANQRSRDERPNDEIERDRLIRLGLLNLASNPEEALRKAEEVRRDAQTVDATGDGDRIAALAAQIELRARAEIAEQKALEEQQREQQIVAERSEREEREAEREKSQLSEAEANIERDQSRFEVEQRELDQRQARAELFNASSRRNIELNQRLIDIGVVKRGPAIGNFLNQRV